MPPAASRRSPASCLRLAFGTFGESTAKQLAAAFGDLDTVRRAPEPVLACLPDIGSVVAHSIAHFFRLPEQQKLLDDLLHFVSPQEAAITTPVPEYATPARWLARLPDYKISEKRAQELWDLAGGSIAQLLADDALPSDWQAWRRQPENAQLLREIDAFLAQLPAPSMQPENAVSGSLKNEIAGKFLYSPARCPRSNATKPPR